MNSAKVRLESARSYGGIILQEMGRNGRMERDNGDPLVEEQCRFGYMQNEENQSNSSTCVTDSCVFNAKFKVVNHRQCKEKPETQVVHNNTLDLHLRRPSASQAD